MPSGIAVAANGHVLVTEMGNQRVQVLTDEGGFVRAWGGEGSGPGLFVGPWAVAVGADDRIYVLDSGNNRVQVFDPEGGFLFAWGSEGVGPAEFQSPRGICVGGGGRVEEREIANSLLISTNRPRFLLGPRTESSPDSAEDNSRGHPLHSFRVSP